MLQKQQFENIMRESAILNLSGMMEDASISQLIYPLSKDPTEYLINLTELQRLNLQAMRTRLARDAFNIFDKKALTQNKAMCMARLMHEYCMLDHYC